ncbi:MAG TPA: FtsX-like permease family protein [Thermoanaerobaculia bacterium]|nr:FtsX-like permease family protein [Thermoanaerobaculia bacterium]
MIRCLPRVGRNLGRRKARTLFTVLSILVAFLLYGLLGAIRAGFEMGAEIVGADRLITIHKVSLIQPLPVRYGDRMRAIDGIVEVAHGTWFGGVYQDPKNFFAQVAVESEPFLALYPEYVLEAEERERWLANRTGALVGASLARRFGWQVGDRIPIQGTIWRRAGDEAWEFTIEGIYEPAEQGVDDSQFFFHWVFLDEARTFGDGLVGWYWMRVADPERAAELAAAVDETFANSPAETRTATEKVFVQGFARQVGDIGAIVAGILAAVFFTILLVAGNTLAQSVRERTAELAVMKSLGFTDGRVAALVLAEAAAYAVVGGGLGLLLAWAFVAQGDPTGGMLPSFYLPRAHLVTGVLLIAGLALVAGLLPAIEARRLPISAALRRA